MLASAGQSVGEHPPKAGKVIKVIKVFKVFKEFKVVAKKEHEMSATLRTLTDLKDFDGRQTYLAGGNKKTDGKTSVCFE